MALRDPHATDHKTTFAELQKMTPHFDWTAYLRRREDAARRPQRGRAEVPGGVRPAARRDVRWQIGRPIYAGKCCTQSATFLSQPFVDENFDFYQKTLAGVTELKPRWKRCAESTDLLLGEALGQEYVARYFPPEAKARAQEHGQEHPVRPWPTRSKGLDWMTPDTKKKALEKMSTFNVKVGYPDKWKDYSSGRYHRGDLLRRCDRAARKFVVADDRAQIGKPIDRGRWGMTPPTSNAYYNPLMNEIVFPGRNPAAAGLQREATPTR